MLGQRPDRVTMNSALECLARLPGDDSLASVLRLLDEMEAGGEDLRPDAATWGAVLRAVLCTAEGAKGRGATLALQRRLLHRAGPAALAEPSLRSVLVQATCACGDLEGSLRLLNRLALKQRRPLSKDAYLALLRAFSREGCGPVVCQLADRVLAEPAGLPLNAEELAEVARLRSLHLTDRR